MKLEEDRGHFTGAIFGAFETFESKIFFECLFLELRIFPFSFERPVGENCEYIIVVEFD